jgi:electron transfer flavoprotein beta subunit
VTRLLDVANEVVEVRMPVLITVVKQINEPRHPPMKGVLRAKKAQIPVLTAADLNLDPKQIGFAGSPTWVWKVFTPPRRQRGEMIEGDLQHKIDALVEKILSLGIVSRSN